MPEGHLIHHYARRQSELAGRAVAALSPQGRFAEGAAEIDGKVLRVVEPYGKHLVYRFDPDVLVHLGMTGKWARTSGPPRPQVRLRLASGDLQWDLFAPSRCELLAPSDVDALLATLGPDPLRDDADPDVAWQRFSAFGGPVGAALLDQRIVAGVGNVLRTEVLFELAIHPATPADAIGEPGFRAIWDTLVRVMRASADAGTIVSAGPDGARYVYKRETCARCASPIVAGSIGGRTSYACEHCQPLA